MADGAAEDGSDAAVGDADAGAGDATTEELRRRVEEEYDFEDFGPQDMAEMSPDEWEAAFDPDTWITGTELLDRVEADINARVARRDVFAVVERESKGSRERLVAYSDEGYALVYEDGTVEGRGTVLRDVKPSVALCSMEDYDVPDAPAGGLPEPGAVPEGSGSLGHTLMLGVGSAQILAGAALFGGWLGPDLGVAAAVAGGALVLVGAVLALVSLLSGLGVGGAAGALGSAALGVFVLGAWAGSGLGVIAAVAAFGFAAFGAFMLALVANARLSDRFRSEEYRERLRDAGVTADERPSFVPDWGDREAEKPE
jgi:hypothetical protein